MSKFFQPFAEPARSPHWQILAGADQLSVCVQAPRVSRYAETNPQTYIPARITRHTVASRM